MHLEPDVAHQLSAAGSMLIQVLLSASVALGGAAINELRKWLASRSKNRTIRDAMEIVADLVMTIVRNLEQTEVGVLRDANGRLDTATAQKMKERAVRFFQELYGPEGLKDLAARLGTSEDATLRYVGAMIEQAVYLLKNPPIAPVVFDPNVFGGMTPSEKLSAAMPAEKGN